MVIKSRAGRLVVGAILVLAAFLVGGDTIRMAVSGESLHLVALAKGLLLCLVGVLAIVSICLTWREARLAKPRPLSPEEIIALAEKRRKREEGASPWDEEHTRPQTMDWDDGTCPYKRDWSQPLGSKACPVVVGQPAASTHRVFSRERGCWILTDGLGNGWIR